MPRGENSVPQSETEPGSAESVKPEQAMLSKVEVMQDARDNVLAAEPFLTQAGVSQEAINKASELAAKEAQETFEKREKNDPLRIMERELVQSAESRDERKMVAAIISEAEDRREKLLTAFRKEQLNDKRSHRPIRTVTEIAQQVITDGGYSQQDALEYGIVTNLDERGDENTYAKLRLIDRYIIVRPRGKKTYEERKKGRKEEITYDVAERFLHGIGALEKDEVSEDLGELPMHKEGYGGATSDVDLAGGGHDYRIKVIQAQRVPTSIPGIRLNVERRKDQESPSSKPTLEIDLLIDLPTLEKILALKGPHVQKGLLKSE